MRCPSNPIRWLVPFAACLLFFAGSFAFTQASEHRTHGVVEWYADLTGAKDTSGVLADAVRTPATGKATVSFDFNNQTAIFTVEAREIKDVQKIELRSARARGDISGPTLLTLYDAKEGPFPGKVTQTVVHQVFNQIKSPVLNGQGVVVITTKAHPDGEVAGIITMHKHYE
jgi:hypothetical protein